MDITIIVCAATTDREAELLGVELEERLMNKGLSPRLIDLKPHVTSRDLKTLSDQVRLAEGVILLIQTNKPLFPNSLYQLMEWAPENWSEKWTASAIISPDRSFIGSVANHLDFTFHQLNAFYYRQYLGITEVERKMNRELQVEDPTFDKQIQEFSDGFISQVIERNSRVAISDYFH